MACSCSDPLIQKISEVTLWTVSKIGVLHRSKLFLLRRSLYSATAESQKMGRWYSVMDVISALTKSV